MPDTHVAKTTTAGPEAPPADFAIVRRNPADTAARLLDTFAGTVKAIMVRSDGPDLSLRQLAVLLIVYRTDGPHTVRGMAADLCVAKPAITRALDRLGELDLVRRKVDPMDRRSVLAQRTVRGAAWMRQLTAHLDAAECGALS